MGGNQLHDEMEWTEKRRTLFQGVLGEETIGVGTKAKVQGLFPDDSNAPSRPFGDGLAYGKAEEAAYTRYQAAQWLRKMDQGASESLSSNPSEEEFCLALRNGLTLCNVLITCNSYSFIPTPFMVFQGDGRDDSSSRFEYLLTVINRIYQQ
ncbi:Kinesin-4 [Nymphaea thermarum]|nr:Kinesin-4 [Nymphaea thermarum]